MARRLPKLKPCPFCGQSDAFVERRDFSSAYVFCNACSAKGPTQYPEDNDGDEDEPGGRAAIRAWNKRTRAIRKEADHD
ncbi:Lar family restriction alleviation protein [Ciceribacter ferrooxidans]|uniref:Restriction alleviation protein, Lar family n=1 Tax=Ciceribacter ferrooxidans TaxID=2509717 RepID=A0A4Q2SZV2_9HYPH|nr:Lar family restriction alleviation protein [Ciceribacter ferrooxidans]RYC10140.1 restriction alleviation protein, Lar family [Ciceribacter ferrooxidans]